MITVTKVGSSHEYLIILAEKIVKPLIEKFSKSEISVDSALQEKKEIKRHNCQHCDNIFTTSPGLKGHITKMHKAKKVGLRTKHQNSQSTSLKIALKSQSSDDEVSKVIESLLTDVVEDGNSDGFLIDLNVTLAENIDHGDDKQYIDGCDQCDFRITASKKYIALQLLKKHKVEHHSKPCSQCDFKANSLQEMKRHMRDSHDVKTESTSPPNKKKRKQNQEEEVDLDINDESIKDLSFKLEDMEIDSTNDEIEERSKKMDEKIAANVKRIEEEEKLQKEKAKEKEMKKKREERIRIEKINKQSKQQKQKMKDEKKKKRKHNSIKQTNHEEKINNIPNIRPVPSNCKHLVNVGDVVYVVPGDGSCGPSSASAFLFGDEIFGPKLR